ncbi:MAG TPA: hypothetical protein PLZ37_01170 [Nitrospira sp.]|nr:hypothetical protein [Nitrospira sp.]
MTETKSWIIAVSNDRPIQDIAKDLTNAGLRGTKVLKEINVITGKAANNVLEKLRKVRGVIDVSPDVPVDVGPPDSPNTW